MKKRFAFFTTLAALVLTFTVLPANASEATYSEPVRSHGFVVPEGWGRSFGSLSGYGLDGDVVLPAKYDSREALSLPATRDQGTYGTCWAHVAIASIEINLVKKDLADSSIDLSELQLAYFANYSAKDELGFSDGDSRSFEDSDGCFLCNGGNSWMAMNALTANVYPAKENSDEKLEYSYADVVHSNKLPEEYNDGDMHDIDMQDDALAYKDGYVRLVGYADLDISNPDVVKKAIKEFGAADASYCDVVKYWDDYYGNALNFYNPNPVVEGDYDTYPNHEICVVGWDDNYSKDNFKDCGSTPLHDGAWICRNSWGAYNSEGGYFYISYDDKTFGYVCIYEAELLEKDTNTYFYDNTAYFPTYGIYKGGAANVYKAKGNSKGYEELYSIGAWVCKKTNCDVYADIYVNLTDAKNPLSGKLAKSIKLDVPSGVTDYLHWVTADLQEAISIPEGSYFSVVIRENDNVIVQGKLGSKPGQSFAIVGDKVIDLNQTGKYSKDALNYCINAYTRDKTCEHTNTTNKVTKATTGKNGKIEKICTSCKTVVKTSTINRAYVAIEATQAYYTGKAITPKITVKDKDGKAISASYYKVKYYDNKKIGKARAVVTFKGNYEGTVTKYFNIVKKAVKPDKVKSLNLTAGKKAITVSWKALDKNCVGYEVQYSTDKNFAEKYTKTKKITKAKTNSLKLTGLSAKKTYYIRVRAYNTEKKDVAYSSWTTAKSVKTK